MDNQQQKPNQTINQQITNQQHNQPKQQRNQHEASLGVDLDEQEMNDMYGMLETEAEDQLD